MSIKAVKLALEALENASPSAWASRVDSDKMKSIWRKHAEALEGPQVLLAELDNASCKSAQKRLEAQQPASKEHIFELWWEAHMPNTTQEQAWTAFTAAVASNGVGIAAQQSATPEPTWCVATGERVNGEETYTHHDAYVPLADCFPLYTHPAPGVPDGWRIEEKGSDIIVRKYGFGGYSARKNTESIAEAVLHELALDLLAASPAQKGGE